MNPRCRSDLPTPPPARSTNARSDRPARRLMRVAAGVALSVCMGLAGAQDAAPHGPAPSPFQDVSRTAGIDAPHHGVWDLDEGEGYLGMGQAWGDYDRDGWLDLYLTGNRNENVLLVNRGDGTFEVSPFAAQVALPDATSGGALWGDYDNDGWPDLYVLNHGANRLFRNDQGKGFIDVTDAAGVGDPGKGQSATWGDYDGDGHLDLYVANWSCTPECEPETHEANRDRLYRNDGSGRFTDVTDLLDEAATLGAGFAASFFDYDGDGDIDLYVVNDKYRNPIGNVLWRNDGPGCGGWCFTDVSRDAGVGAVMHGMGLAIGDYDGDGTPDMYVSNMMSPMMLVRGSGDGSFADTTWTAGVGINPPGTAVGWGTAFLDYDNDGWLDLYLATTGMPKLSASFYSGKQPAMEDFRNPYADSLFRNLGDGTFERVPSPDADDGGRPTMGLAYADYDNDGFVDLVAGIWNENYALYRNVSGDPGGSAEDRRWLVVALEGGGPVNRDAVGARVTVTDASGQRQVRDVIAGSSFGAGNDLRLHFGLGDSERVDVHVRWPDGLERDYPGIAADQIWRIAYPVEGDDQP